MRRSARPDLPSKRHRYDEALAVSRRETLVIAMGAVGSIASVVVGSQPLVAADDSEGHWTESHGMSAFGDLKYPADFKHFDYVDPDAPKGGMFSQVGPSKLYNQNFFTFNSLNSFILKGDAAMGMEMTFATLMAPTTAVTTVHDEPDAMYGSAARAVRLSDDGLTYRFLMRPQALFHDGSKLTAQDVAFSLNLLKDKGHPLITQQLRDFIGAEARDEETVVARFAPKRARDVPLLVANLPIFSRNYYANRPFDESTLDTPLGSGGYKVGRFDVGHFIEYERVKDWWGADLPNWRGLNNFDVVRYEFYRDREAAFQAFTAKNYLFREEFTSRVWATRYDFPSLRDGRVKREVIPDDTPSGAQGWFMNTRREKFKNPKLREAVIDAFDFEWTNKNIMYGAYKRTYSVFQNSDMEAKGKPSAEELKLLEPFRGKVSDEVFGEPYMPPVSDGSGLDRRLLRRASALLQQAGYVIKNGKRVMPNGEPITMEFLLDEEDFQPHHLPFIKNLATLGIDATLRLVDPVQHRARQDSFDFDIIIDRFQFSSTPGESLRTFFSSDAAKTNGSHNLAGIADPAIDALIERIIAAPTREDLTVACRALDRVFRAGRYWISQWFLASHRIAYWDVFGRPATKPRYGRGIPETWWYDRDKAAKLER